MSIRALAQQAYDSFETATRSDGTTYVATSANAPDWLKPIVHAAHGDMLPDDWRYDVIQDAFGRIADSGSDLDDLSSEFADDADIYNSDLLAWVGSHGSRAGYVDDATQEFGEPRDFYHSLQMGQYMERQEIFDAVLQGLRDLDEEKDEDE